MKSLKSFRDSHLELNSLEKIVGGELPGKTKRRSVSKDVNDQVVDKCWHEDAKSS